jgi:hypothetical protein
MPLRLQCGSFHSARNRCQRDFLFQKKFMGVETFTNIDEQITDHWEKHGRCDNSICRALESNRFKRACNSDGAKYAFDAVWGCVRLNESDIFRCFNPKLVHWCIFAAHYVCRRSSRYKPLSVQFSGAFLRSCSECNSIFAFMLTFQLSIRGKVYDAKAYGKAHHESKGKAHLSVSLYAF